MFNKENNTQNQAKISGGRIAIGASVLALILGSGFYFLAGNAEADSSTDTNVEKTQEADAFTSWQKVRNSFDVKELQDFVRKFPESPFVGRAENRILDLAPAGTTSELEDEKVTEQAAEETEETETVTETVATPTNAEVAPPAAPVKKAVATPTAKPKKKVRSATLYEEQNYTPRKRKVYRKRHFRRKRHGCH